MSSALKLKITIATKIAKEKRAGTLGFLRNKIPRAIMISITANIIERVTRSNGVSFVKSIINFGKNPNHVLGL